MNRTQVVLFVTLVAVVGVGVVPAVTGMSATDTAPATQRSVQDDPNPGGGDEGTPWLAPATGGKANQGREDDEKQQFPGNTSFRIDDHAPGATENSFNIFAVGFSENIRMHWNVVDQEDFRWDGCTSTDATAFGVDRGNDDPGTETDKSLLDAYESVTYTEDGIFVKFYKEEALAGSPVNISINDQIVSRVTNCLQNPDEPGWYRMTGYINGSTKMDTTTDFTIYGAAKYVYICENCDSREDAIDELGPPPTTCPTTDEFAQDSKEWTCRTENGEYYTRSNPPSGDSTPTETPPPGATETPTETATGGSDAPTDTPTAAATPTPTEASGGAENTPTATPTPTATGASGGSSGGDNGGSGSGSGSSSGGDGGNDLSRTTTSTTGGGSGPGNGGGGAASDATPLTPTAGAGPGLGIAAALAGLAVALVLLRRD